MKVGSLIYGCSSGLGILAKAFYDNGIITHPYIVKHAHHHTHFEWYPQHTPWTPIRHIDLPAVRKWLKGLDVFLALETPYHWELFNDAREAGVKTVLMPMYEVSPREWPAEPDLFLNPSLLDQQYFPRGTFLPVPVDVPWRLRERAETFVHNAGWGGLKGRNGTGELLDAWRAVKSPAKLTIRSQKALPWDASDPRIKVEVGTVPYDRLWETGDCFVFSEKFNGLSLPLQEAHAAGMLVMGSDRFPMNTWLPNGPLIPVVGYRRNSVSPRCVEFDEAIIEPKAIADKVDEFYGQDIRAFSERGREWAEEHSWERLGPRYKAILEGL